MKALMRFQSSQSHLSKAKPQLSLPTINLLLPLGLLHVKVAGKTKTPHTTLHYKKKWEEKRTTRRTTNECKQKSCHTKNFHNFSLGICSIIFLNSSFPASRRVVVRVVALNVNGRAVQHGGIQHTYMRQDVLNMRAAACLPAAANNMPDGGTGEERRRQRHRGSCWWWETGREWGCGRQSGGMSVSVSPCPGEGCLQMYSLLKLAYLMRAAR